MIVRELAASETLNLRNAVLRPGKPLSECVFDGDDAPLTRHFGALDAQGNIIGVASIYRVAHPDIAGEPQFQLRGMAINSAARGQGVGGLLLAGPEQYAQTCGAALIWANARSSAMAFYRRHGYRAVSDEFEIPGVGPHYRVVKALL